MLFLLPLRLPRLRRLITCPPRLYTAAADADIAIAISFSKMPFCRAPRRAAKALLPPRYDFSL